MRIYLVGMPASGKSTVGNKLAEKLGYNFVDIDDLIVEKEGMSITELFSEKGEEYFRMIEATILRDTLPENSVIATGGGVPCFFDNMDFIKNNGISVYLKVDVEDLATRSMAQHGTRPLLNGLSGNKLVEELALKLGKRERYYTQADIILKAKHPDLETLIYQLCGTHH